MPLGVSPLDSAQREGRLWTPLQLRASAGGLFAFIEAYDVASISRGSTGVQQWRDKSGRNNHFGYGTVEPAVLSSGRVYFAGTSSERLFTPAVPYTAFSPNGQTGLLAFTMRYISGTVQMKWQSSASDRIGIETGSRVDWPNDTAASGGGKLESWSENIDSSALKLCSIRRTTTGKTVRINGKEVASDTNATVMSTGGDNPWYIGSDPSGLESVCEFGAWLFTAHSDPLTEQRVEGYLAWQAGIRLAASHPYRDAPPLIGG